MDARLGTNVNGPSLIRVPDWLEDPLGRYYLYFAHHQGQFIRMAYADRIEGPYTVFPPGVLSIEEAPFSHHIASPDVHVDDEAKQILMHYHGCAPTGENPFTHGQLTCYAESTDGLDFTSDTVYLAQPYLRTFFRGGWYYGFSGGFRRHFSRSRDRRSPFEVGPVLEIQGEDFTDFSTYDRDDPGAPPVYRMRHVCFHRRGDDLDIYYSCVGDRPERIKRTRVDLTAGWEEWRGCRPAEVLQSERDWEGVEEPLVRSEGGSKHEPVHELRDPYVHEENGRAYLFYSVAGEQGIGLAEVRE
jgi:hypothetical protein